MSQRLRLSEVLIVEGKYDATTLESLVDGLILTTDGFSIFNDIEKKELIRSLGRERGLVVLTDADAAGFKIREYVGKIAAGCEVKHAYIPAVLGKEGRKSAPSKEGTLGVEGMPQHLLRAALEEAGVGVAKPRKGREITHGDLYELGLSGGEGSAERRREVLARLGLPPRLSKKALVKVLSTLYTYEEFMAAIEEKPVLFWDFHGTLTLPVINWFDAAMWAVERAAPGTPFDRAAMEVAFGRRCLPWWELEGGDTRAVTGSRRWWAFCEGQFSEMLVRSGLERAFAQKAAPLIREYILKPENHALYPDAVETLRQLKRRGWRSYILSNNFPELKRVAVGLGLMPYLEGVIVSGLVGWEKPRPELFEYALKQAGRPEQAIMIGDSAREDIAGAKAVGWKAVAVHGVEAPGADHMVDALSELLEIL